MLTLQDRENHVSDAGGQRGVDRSVLRSYRTDRPMVNAGAVSQMHEAAWYLVRKGGPRCPAHVPR